jgi:hypothetical protein
MGLSRLAEQCEKCQFKDTCKNKRMEAVAYLPDPVAHNGPDMLITEREFTVNCVSQDAETFVRDEANLNYLKQKIIESLGVNGCIVKGE